MLSSYSDVFGLTDEPTADEPLQPGDLVRTGSNHFPHFEVLAVHGATAWVRNVQTGADHLTAAGRCRRIAPPAEALLAAE
jgi:hypothetical protein